MGEVNFFYRAKWNGLLGRVMTKTQIFRLNKNRINPIGGIIEAWIEWEFDECNRRKKYIAKLIKFSITFADESESWTCGTVLECIVFLFLQFISGIWWTPPGRTENYQACRDLEHTTNFMRSRNARTACHLHLKVEVPYTNKIGAFTIVAWGMPGY